MLVKTSAWISLPTAQVPEVPALLVEAHTNPLLGM